MAGENYGNYSRDELFQLLDSEGGKELVKKDLIKIAKNPNLYEGSPQQVAELLNKLINVNTNEDGSHKSFNVELEIVKKEETPVEILNKIAERVPDDDSNNVGKQILVGVVAHKHADDSTYQVVAKEPRAQHETLMMIVERTKEAATLDLVLAHHKFESKKEDLDKVLAKEELSPVALLIAGQKRDSQNLIKIKSFIQQKVGSPIESEPTERDKIWLKNASTEDLIGMLTYYRDLLKTLAEVNAKIVKQEDLYKVNLDANTLAAIAENKNASPDVLKEVSKLSDKDVKVLEVIANNENADDEVLREVVGLNENDGKALSDNVDLAIAMNKNTPDHILAAVAQRVPDDKATPLQKSILREAINNPNADKIAHMAIANEPCASEDTLQELVRKTKLANVLAKVFERDKYLRSEENLKLLVSNEKISGKTLLEVVKENSDLLKAKEFSKDQLIKFFKAKKDGNIPEELRKYSENRLLKVLQNPNADEDVIALVAKVNEVKEEGSEAKARFDKVDLAIAQNIKTPTAVLNTVAQRVPDEDASGTQKDILKAVIQNPNADESTYAVVADEPRARDEVLTELAKLTKNTETLKKLIAHDKYSDKTDEWLKIVNNEVATDEVLEQVKARCANKPRVLAAIEDKLHPEQQQARAEARQVIEAGETEARRFRAVEEVREASKKGGDALLGCFRRLQTEQEKDSVVDDHGMRDQLADLGEQGKLSVDEQRVVVQAIRRNMRQA